MHNTPYLIREENTFSFAGIIGSNPGVALKVQFTLTRDIKSQRFQKELSWMLILYEECSGNSQSRVPLEGDFEVSVASSRSIEGIPF